jgi:hypothetical protein
MFKLKNMIFFLLVSGFAFSQEALKSEAEEYYDFLALQGLAERPFLNYRTLSDSVWQVKPEAAHPWQNQNLGTRRSLFADLSLRIYGPELFMSVNTAAPYGQNDGALWQGKGFNTSLTGGARLEGYGVELTFKPQLAFSQNLAFDIMQPAYSGQDYAGKAADYGYYGITSIDAPQRFGDKPFFTYDWGDSEIRYSWKTLTIGFGTQAIWMGPAQLNPIIHSNNAPSYPKLDMGIRKQRMVMPKLGWYLGDIETRLWWGYLSESDFFDNSGSNNHNLITGFSIAYGVPFLPGLTVGFNRIMLSEWDPQNFISIFSLIIPKIESGDVDDADQRFSFVLDYLLPAVGLNIYFEWARNDNSPDFDFVMKYPFHTQAYTFGMRKSIGITNSIKGEISLELSNLESSRDYDNAIPWATTFYAHYQISQGHTNRGQWLGAGIGTGGNSQYIGFKLYYPKGHGEIFFQRRNPDLDYSWFIDSKKYPSEYPVKHNVEWNFRTYFDIGISSLYHFTRNFSINSALIVRDELNPLNKSTSLTNSSSVHRYNVFIAAGFKYEF